MRGISYAHSLRSNNEGIWRQRQSIRRQSARETISGGVSKEAAAINDKRPVSEIRKQRNLWHGSKHRKSSWRQRNMAA